MPPLAQTIAFLIAQYGIPGFIQIWGIISKPTITEADIQVLRDIKPPESFFTFKMASG